MVNKRRATPRQLENLRRGREKLFQNQLRRTGINLNPRPQIIREVVVKQPIVNQTTQHNHNIKLQLSLFKQLLNANLFSIETNNKTQDYNFRGIISYLISRLNNQEKMIMANQNNISNIISYVNKKNKDYENKFNELNKKISDLEKENLNIKKKINNSEESGEKD